MNTKNIKPNPFILILNKRNANPTADTFTTDEHGKGQRMVTYQMREENWFHMSSLKNVYNAIVLKN